MVSKLAAFRSRPAAVALALLLAMVGTGCATGPSFTGKWQTDRTALKGTPSEENDLAEWLAPTLKFTIQFADNGTFTSTWTDESGASGTRSGTWKLIEDLGLKWRITMTMQPDNEEWEVMVGSPETNAISLEALGDFKRGGPVYFRRSR